jgi:spore maturation protein CgeB
MHMVLVHEGELAEAVRAHLGSLAGALARAGAELRLAPLAAAGLPAARLAGALERAAEGAGCVLALADGAGLGEGLERALLGLRAQSLLVRVEAAPEETALFAGAWPREQALAALAGYDAIALLGGGAEHAAVYRSLGAPRVVTLGPALDPALFMPTRPRRADLCDLLYVGPRDPAAEDAVRRLVLGPAAALEKRRFALAGSGWEEMPRPANVVAVGPAGAVERNALYAAGRFVLVPGEPDAPPAGADERGTAFEAAGAAACIIGESGRGLERAFKPSEECLLARGPEDIARILTVVSPSRAREIGRRARARALRDHTFDARAARLLDALEGALERRRGPRPAGLSAQATATTMGA